MCHCGALQLLNLVHLSVRAHVSSTCHKQNQRCDVMFISSLSPACTFGNNTIGCHRSTMQCIQPHSSAVWYMILCDHIQTRVIQKQTRACTCLVSCPSCTILTGARLRGWARDQHTCLPSWAYFRPIHCYIMIILIIIIISCLPLNYYVIAIAFIATALWDINHEYWSSSTDLSWNYDYITSNLQFNLAQLHDANINYLLINFFNADVII